MKAIDVHAHFGSHDKGAGPMVDRLMSAEIETVSRRAQEVDICITVVSPFLALGPYTGDALRGNDSSREASERCSDIRFWAVLNPRLPESYKQVESLLTHPACKGIKIHPVAHNYEIRDRGEEIFAFAASQKAVVMTHSGCVRSFPEDFIPFADRYPEVTLILAHLGNSADGNLSRQVWAVKHAHNQNIYVDTSSAKSMFTGLIEWAVSQVGAQKLLFGTDSPCYFPASQKARIEYAEIDKGARRAILYDNAARLLKEQVVSKVT